MGKEKSKTASMEKSLENSALGSCQANLMKGEMRRELKILTKE